MCLIFFDFSNCCKTTTYKMWLKVRNLLKDRVLLIWAYFVFLRKPDAVNWLCILVSLQTITILFDTYPQSLLCFLVSIFLWQGSRCLLSKQPLYCLISKTNKPANDNRRTRLFNLGCKKMWGLCACIYKVYSRVQCKCCAKRRP